VKWPYTLFGRLLLVLGSGLLVAQLLSAAINLAERDRLLSSSFGQQPAQRVADVVRLLDGMDAAQRQALLAVFRTPPLVLSLQAEPTVPADAATAWQAQMFSARLQSALVRSARGAGAAARRLRGPRRLGGEREGHRGPQDGDGWGHGPRRGSPAWARAARTAGGLPVVRIEVPLARWHLGPLRHGAARTSPTPCPGAWR
jgi:hypothetical protein